MFDSLRVHLLQEQLRFLTDILSGIESHLRTARYCAMRPLLQKPVGETKPTEAAAGNRFGWKPFWLHALRCVQLDMHISNNKRGWQATTHLSLVALQYIALRKRLAHALVHRTFTTFETVHEEVNESIKGIDESKSFSPANLEDIAVTIQALGCSKQSFAFRALCMHRAPESAYASPEPSADGDPAEAPPVSRRLQTLASMHRVQLEFDCILPILTASSLRVLAVRDNAALFSPVIESSSSNGSAEVVPGSAASAATKDSGTGAAALKDSGTGSNVRGGTLTVTLVELVGVADSATGGAKPVCSLWIGDGDATDPDADDNGMGDGGNTETCASLRSTRVGVRKNAGRPPPHLYLDTFTFKVHGGVLRDELGERAGACEDFLHISCRDNGATVFDSDLGHAKLDMRELTTLSEGGHELKLVLSDGSFWRKPDASITVFAHFHLDGMPPQPGGAMSSLDVLRIRRPALFEATASQISHRDHDQSFAEDSAMVTARVSENDRDQNVRKNGSAESDVSAPEVDTRPARIEIGVTLHIPILRVHLHRPAPSITQHLVAGKEVARAAIRRYSASLPQPLPSAESPSLADPGAQTPKRDAGPPKHDSATLAMHLTVERMLIDIENLEFTVTKTDQLNTEATLGELRVAEYRSNGAMFNAASLKHAVIKLDGVRNRHARVRVAALPNAHFYYTSLAFCALACRLGPNTLW